MLLVVVAVWWCLPVFPESHWSWTPAVLRWASRSEGVKDRRWRECRTWTQENELKSAKLHFRVRLKPLWGPRRIFSRFNQRCEASLTCAEQKSLPMGMANESSSDQYGAERKTIGSWVRPTDQSGRRRMAATAVCRVEIQLDSVASA